MPKKEDPKQQAAATEAEIAEENKKPAARKPRSTTSRKKATAQPVQEDTAQPVQENTAPAAKEDKNESAATKPRRKTATPKKPKTAAPVAEQAQQPLEEQQTQPPFAQGEGAPDAAAPAQARDEQALLLNAPNNKLPVREPRSTAVQPALPPVNFAVLGRERRNFWGRLFLLICVGVVLALSVVIFIYRPTVYSAYSHSIRFLYDADQNATLVVYDGKLSETRLSGECTQMMRDTTGSVCAATVGDRLYVVQGDEVSEISSTVQDFLLAQNGRVLVYRDAENHMYYVKLGRKNERFTVTRDSRDSRYCLSPDGEMLFYTYVEKLENSEEAVDSEVFKTHAAVFSLSGLKPFFPSTTGIIPVAISDDFEHIFYLDEANDLYYMNEKSEISLCRRYDEGGMEILFDREFEEVLIKDAKGIMLWRYGKEVLIPQLKGAENLTLIANQRAIYRDLSVGEQCMVRGFYDNYYLKKGTDEQGTRLAYLKGGELTEVAFVNEEESRPVVTDKGVYYLEREETNDGVRKHLYLCPIGKTVAHQLSWDVKDFCMNSDGSGMLHVNHQGALYASRVSGKRLDSVLISDFIDGGLQGVTATDVFYYFVNGTLYASNNGDVPQAIPQTVHGIEIDAHTAFFYTVESEQADGVTVTVYARHRNRRDAVKIATGIEKLSQIP